ncbi:tape measure domain-containing protein [Aequitasia blattaphilus]|uniref:Tape measure protein n=1 Tax=Aequitasia blattaphilus TaxID=2949332 RepID=A0ABT1E9U8_9FIRM|nr:tape measure protein [Aequitasia blattaphilus]MCP1102597.1 tape measure protein [Aequitasia blattaphilus]MCR8615237.1 tape measure protein [Aequitasia blattaphilus]
MADGKVKIVINVDDKDASRSVNEISNSFNGLDGSAQKANSGIKTMTVSLLAAKAAAKGLEILKSSLDGAISRFDTMNRFPKMMQNLGYSALDAKNAINKLSDGIDGLPTSLDEVVASAQNLALITGDLESATDTTIALNNAFLASGASSVDASRGLTQYVQMLSSGKVDMQSWKTLLETMPYALTKVAESFGFVGESAKNDLYAALRDGEITFSDFNAKLVELNEGMGGFAELARVNSEGIATSFKNIKTAVTKGVTDVITAFDKMVTTMTGKNIAQNLNSLKGTINDVFKGVAKSVEFAGKAFVALTPAIKGATAGLIAFKAAMTIDSVVRKVSTALEIANSALMTADLVTGSYTVVLSSRAAAQAAATKATERDTAMQLANNGVITTKTLLIGVLTGQIGIVTAATSLWNDVMLANPAIATAAALAVLVGGVMALDKVIMSNNDNLRKMREEHEELISSSNELLKSTESNQKARKEQLSDIDNESQAYNKLASQVVSLAKDVKNGSGSLEELQSVINTLNSSVDGLNLAYDSVSGTLNKTEGEIRAQISAWKDLAEAQAAQEMLVEATKEQIAIENQLNEVKEKTKGISKEEKEGILEYSKIRQLYSQQQVDAVEKESELQEAYRKSGDEIELLTGRMESSLVEQQQTTDATTGQMVSSYDKLSDGAKSAVDDITSAYQDLYTQSSDMFDQISIKSAQSMDEMIQNLQFNQQAMLDWSTNIQTLAQRAADLGLDQGFVQRMRELGPEYAQHVATMVGATDEELSTLSNQFSLAGDHADVALKEKIGGIDLAPEIEAMAKTIPETLASTVAAADFSGIGQGVSEKVATSVTENQEAVDTAGTEMVQGFETAATTAVESSEIGTTVATGITEKVQTSMAESQESMKMLGTTMVTTILGAIVEAIGIANFAIVGTQVTQKINEGFTESTGFEGVGTTVVQKITTDINTAVAAADYSAMGMSVMTQVVQAVNLAMATADFSLTGQNIVIGINNGVLSQQGILTGTIQSMMSMINMSFQVGLANINMVSAMAFTMFVATTRTNMAQANAATNSGMQTMQTTFRVGFATSTAVANSGMNSFRNAVSNGMNASVSATRSGCGSMTSIVSSLESAFYSYGLNAGYGLARGISAGGDAAIAAAQSIADRVKATIQAAMDIHSPSRWMRDFIAKNMMLGWADGFDKYAKYPELALAGVAENVVLPALNAEKLLGNRVSAMVGTNTTNNYYNRQNNESPQYIVVENVLEMNDEVVGRNTATIVKQTNDRRDYIRKKVRGEA